MRGGDSSHDICDPLPFSVGEYIEWYGDKLDDQQFSVMHLAEDVRRTRNVGTGSMLDTIRSAENKQ